MYRLAVVATLALLPARVFATSVLQAAEGAQIVNIVLQANKATSEAAIEAWNQDKSELFAQSCSHSLASGPFEKTVVTFDVDRHTVGNLTVGRQKYTIHEKPDISGGIVCGSVTSAAEIIVNCEVPVSVSLQLQRLTKRNLQVCFPNGSPDLLPIFTKLESTPRGSPLLGGGAVLCCGCVMHDCTVVVLRV